MTSFFLENKSSTYNEKNSGDFFFFRIYSHQALTNFSFEAEAVAQWCERWFHEPEFVWSNLYRLAMVM
jgi:hypothetical protein